MTVTGPTLSRDEARVRIGALKEDVPRFVTALESSEDEEHEKETREAIANAYRKIVLFSVYVGDDEEAERSFPKATDWYLDHFDAIEESETLTLRGREDVRALLDLMEVAVLSGDDDTRAEASNRVLASTVEDATGHEGLVALAELLATLVVDGDVGARLEDVDVDASNTGDPDSDADGPDFVASAIEAVRGIHEADSDLVVSGIEGVLEAHPRADSAERHAPASLDALALYALARERSLVTYDDISVDSELLSEYHPAGQ